MASESDSYVPPEGQSQERSLQHVEDCSRLGTALTRQLHKVNASLLELLASLSALLLGKAAWRRYNERQSALI